MGQIMMGKWSQVLFNALVIFVDHFITKPHSVLVYFLILFFIIFYFFLKILESLGLENSLKNIQKLDLKNIYSVC